MKTQFGNLVTGDSQNSTLTFEIEGDMVMQAGKYAIVPVVDNEKIIQVSDEMYKFLMDLSTELNNQDHRCTAMPYFYQIQERKEIPTGEGMGEEVWVCDGEICLRTEADIKKAIFEYKGWEIESNTDNEKYKALLSYEQDEILENNYRKCCVTSDLTYKNAFLTEKACKKHIKLNNYHYTNPSDFLNHAFRNPELEQVMEFICNLTGGAAHK